MAAGPPNSGGKSGALNCFSIKHITIRDHFFEIFIPKILVLLFISKVVLYYRKKIVRKNPKKFIDYLSTKVASYRTKVATYRTKVAIF